MLVHLNSRYRTNPNETSSNYNQVLNLPVDQAKNFKTVKVVNCTIPNSLANIKDYILTWSEPSGGGSSQVIKSITIPEGQYTLDTFCSTYKSLAQTASGLLIPVFSAVGSPIDSKIIFSIPTSSGVSVTAWKILWSQSTPALAAMCGFKPIDTDLVADDFVSTLTYNFSVPAMLYCYLSILPPCIIPGITFKASFPCPMLTNSGLVGVALNDDLVYRMNNSLNAMQIVQVTLLKDDGAIADLRGQDFSITLLFK